LLPCVLCTKLYSQQKCEAKVGTVLENQYGNHHCVRGQKLLQNYMSLKSVLYK